MGKKCILNITMMDATISCWDKYTYFNQDNTSRSVYKTLTGTLISLLCIRTLHLGAASAVYHQVPVKAQSFCSYGKRSFSSKCLDAFYEAIVKRTRTRRKKVGGFAVARALIDGAE
jgi:hypothetical protein